MRARVLVVALAGAFTVAHTTTVLAAQVILRPSSVSMDQWRTVPSSSSSWAAIADNVRQPANVPLTDLIQPSAINAGQVADFGLTTHVLDGEHVTGATAWVYVNTAPSTTLRIDMLWGGVSQGHIVIGNPRNADGSAGAATPFAWRRVDVVSPPPTQTMVDNIRLRFTQGMQSQGSNVEAAYVELTTAPDSVRFAPSSPFNQAIASNAAVDPASGTLVQSLLESAGGAAVNHFVLSVDEYTIPVYEANAATPLRNVQIIGGPPGSRDFPEWLSLGGLGPVDPLTLLTGVSTGAPVGIPIPDNAQPDPGTDGHMTVVDRASGCEYDLYGADKGGEIIRPDGDIATPQWVPSTTGTPGPNWSALDDPVRAPNEWSLDAQSISARTDQLTPQTSEVTLANISLGQGGVMTKGEASFYVTTGRDTAVDVTLLSGGATQGAPVTVDADNGGAWYSIPVAPLSQATLDGLSLRFTARSTAQPAGSLTATVEAAYFRFSTNLTPIGWSAYWANATRIGDTGVYAHGLGARATGFAGLAGLVRPQELAPGSAINHALVFAYPFGKYKTSVPPATSHDGNSMRPDAIPQGARLQLDPNLNVDAIPGITSYEKAIAHALQTYGMILGDTSGALSLVGESRQSPPPGLPSDPYAGLLPPKNPADPYVSLSHIPVASFRVLKLPPESTHAQLLPQVVPTPCAVLH